MSMVVAWAPAGRLGAHGPCAWPAVFRQSGERIEDAICHTRRYGPGLAWTSTASPPPQATFLLRFRCLRNCHKQNLRPANSLSNPCPGHSPKQVRHYRKLDCCRGNANVSRYFTVDAAASAAAPACRAWDGGPLGGQPPGQQLSRRAWMFELFSY